MTLKRNILIAAALTTLVGCYTSSDDDDNSDTSVLDVGNDAANDTDDSDTDTPDTDTPDTDAPDTDTPDISPDVPSDTGPIDIGQDADNEVLCNDACNYFIQCTNMVCFDPLIAFDECVAQCLPDPIEFQADVILNLTCDELIDATCDPNSCECPTSPGNDCADGYQCLVDCSGDAACQQACFDNLSPGGQQTLNDMLVCFSDECSGIPDEEFEACAQNQCGGEIDTCFNGGVNPENLFCLSECDTDMDCGADEFCYELSPDVRGCVAGTPDEPALPPDSPQCNEDQTCGPEQFCVQAGG